jgi:hypothetical protein
MDSSIVHFHELIATLGKLAIVRGHQQGNALTGNQFEQECKD